MSVEPHISEGMKKALLEAKNAARRCEVPVGAALYDAQGVLLASSGNRIIELCDPTAHAELLVIKAGAAKLGSERLVGTVLFTTLEPCAMCAGAIALGRVAKLVFGAQDTKGGAVINGPKFFDSSACHHRPTIEGPVGPQECGLLLKRFFAERRR